MNRSRGDLVIGNTFWSQHKLIKIAPLTTLSSLMFTPILGLLPILIPSTRPNLVIELYLLNVAVLARWLPMNTDFNEVIVAFQWLSKRKIRSRVCHRKWFCYHTSSCCVKVMKLLSHFNDVVCRRAFRRPRIPLICPRTHLSAVLYRMLRVRYPRGRQLFWRISHSKAGKSFTCIESTEILCPLMGSPRG